MKNTIERITIDTSQKVFEYVVAHLGVKRDDVVSGVGMSLATVKRAIEALMTEFTARIEYRGSNKVAESYDWMPTNTSLRTPSKISNMFSPLLHGSISSSFAQCGFMRLRRYSPL